MKKGEGMPFVIYLSFLVLASCATDRWQSAAPVTMEQRLDQGIAQLTTSIEGIDRRLLNRQAVPAVDDPLTELTELDLESWGLRRQQWVLQRHHMMIARDLIEIAKTWPERREEVSKRWAAHSMEYLTQLEDLQRQRAAVDGRRVRTENQVIERSLQ